MIAAEESTGTPTRTCVNVLIADDLSMIRNRLKQLLATENDIRVTCEAADGAQVLECLNKYHVDILVLDLFMPKMDGFEVMKRLRKMHVNIPVIVISALASTPSIKKALSSGAASFISKENAPEELADTIRKLSNRKEVN